MYLRDTAYPRGCVKYWTYLDVYVCMYVVLCLGVADRVCIAVYICVCMSECIQDRMWFLR